MALQLRRGTNAERLAMTPVNGELIFVTDYELVTTSVTSINTTTDTLTTTTAHGLSVNQQVKYIGATLNGLTADQVYFVLTAPTITTFTLSTTSGGGILNITGSFTVDLVFAKTPTNAAGAPLGEGVAILWIGDGATVGGVIAASMNLDDLLDVEITAVAEGNTLYYDATTGLWKNTAIITVDDVTNNVTLSNDLTVTGGDITTGAIAIANLYNSSAIGTINIGNSVVTEVNIGNAASGRVFAKTPSFETQSNATVGGNLTVTGDVAVNGGDITTDDAVAHIFNATATTVNIGNGATTEVNLGNTGAGQVQIKSPTIVGANTTQAVFNTVATTVNAFGASTATAIGSTASGTTTIGYNANILNDLTVTGGDIDRATAGQGNLFNVNATDINIGNGATTSVRIGAPGGSSTVEIKSGTIVGLATTQNVFHTVATTVNAFGFATTALNIGPTASGTTTIGYNATIRNDLSINGTTLTLDADNAGAANNSSIIANRGSSGTDASINWEEANTFWHMSNSLYVDDVAIGGTALATNGNNIYFNNDDGAAADCFITVKKPAAGDPQIKWNETTDRWQTSVDGSTYLNIPNQNLDATDNVTFNDLTTNGNTTLGSNSSDTVTVNGLVSGVISFTDNSTTTNRGIDGTVGANDYWKYGGGATGVDGGYAEIATGDNGTEPIYARQYNAGTPRTLTLMDASGHTTLAGDLTVLGTGYIYSSTGLALDLTGADVRTPGNLTVDADIITTAATVHIANTNSTTVNIGNAATSEVNLGRSGSGRVQLKSPLFCSSEEDVADGAAISLSISSSHFSTGATGETATLGVPATVNGVTNGQFKSLAMLADGGGDMVVTVSNAGWKTSGTGTITFNDIGDCCFLQYIAGKWFALGQNGVTFA